MRLLSLLSALTASTQCTMLLASGNKRPVGEVQCNQHGKRVIPPTTWTCQDVLHYTCTMLLDAFSRLMASFSNTNWSSCASLRATSSPRGATSTSCMTSLRSARAAGTSRPSQDTKGIYRPVQHVPHLSVVDIRELNKTVFT